MKHTTSPATRTLHSFPTHFLSGMAIALLFGALAQPMTMAEDAPPAAQTPPTKTTKTKTTKAKTPRVRGTAYVRVLHAIPGGPRVDISVDGNKTLSDVGFKTISDYMAVPSGQRTFTIRAAGQTDALLSAKKALTADKYYTVAAISSEGKPAFLWQNESVGKDMGGKALLRVFHLATGAATVDVTAPSKRKSATGTTKIVSNLAAGKNRTKRLTAGSYTLQVRQDGKILKESAVMTAEAGKRYSAFIVGKIGSSGDEALEIIIKPAALK